MTTTEDREFLPAMTRPALLRFYDPVSRLLGARDVQWQLVAQAGIEPGATVVEIGCGTGNVLLLAARVVLDATVIGLDPDADALALADRKLRRAGLTVQLDRGYADRLPYADASVDRVLSAFMLHHLSRDEKSRTLHQVRRVLRPGGSLHVLDFGGGHGVLARLLGISQHLRDNSRNTILALMRDAGFVDPTEVAERGSLFGRMIYYRASR